MEAVRSEVAAEGDAGYDLIVFDLQLSGLRTQLERTIKRKNAFLNGNCESLSATDFSSNDASLSPPDSSASAPCTVLDKAAAVTILPKNDLQTKEEMLMCIQELRRLVDELSNQLELTRRQCSEERARRLAAEAELLASRNYQAVKSPYTLRTSRGVNRTALTNSTLSVLTSSDPTASSPTEGARPDSLVEKSRSEPAEWWFDATSE
ncbi:unnamed protein product [Calicophoron daubneyi]